MPNFDSRRVHRLQFAKESGFAHQHTAALTQGAIQGFDDVRLAFAIRVGLMRASYKCLGVGRKQVGEIPVVGALALGQGGQSHTLCRLRPTKVHISSSSSASHFFFCSFLGRKRGSGGEAACAFFYPTGNGYTRDTRHAGNTALRIALAQQFVDLRILHRFRHGGGGEAGLMPASLALVFGMAPGAAIAPNMFTAASGAEVLRKNHPQN